MNRAIYYNYIEQRLNALSLSIKSRGKLNILDYHLHSECFYRDLFNLLFGWNLCNLNEVQQNADAIDLVDTENKIFIQVSATSTKSKIQTSLSRIPVNGYKNYSFKFISIANSAENLKNKTYTIPQSVRFDPKSDIYDNDDVLRKIYPLKTEKLKQIYDLVRIELGTETPTMRLSSNLTTVINLLSQEDLSIECISAVSSFEIERKIEFNDLLDTKLLIVDYNIYQGIVDRIYSSFDAMGKSKSIYVLKKIRKIYIEKQSKAKGDALFKLITEEIKDIVFNSANYDEMTEDEIDFCVDILAVDAFIRCKIFENPEKYNYATT